ncbi:hypothetical protein ACJMK2_035678, partial [Sinanodonta woodiana]
LTVAVKDLGSPSRAGTNSATVLVSVYGNDNPPVFINQPYFTSIDRNTASNSEIYRVTATDADTIDPFNRITLRAIGDDNTLSLFSFSQQGNSGIITTKNTNDIILDGKTRYVMRVEARDGDTLIGYGVRSTTATVQINVQRNLNGPMYSHGSLAVTISENAAPGLFIADVNATDADVTSPENVIAYTITGLSDAANYFFVNPNTGVVTLKSSVRNITASGFTVQVQAADGGTPQRVATTVIDVTITRVIEILSFLSAIYRTTIPETTVVSQIILTVNAAPGPGISYRIVGTSDGPDYFGINPTTGFISVIKDLQSDRNKKTLHTLIVEATRVFTTGPQTASTTVEITVTRNINGPSFLQPGGYITTVLEGLGLGSDVIQLSASDNDALDVLRYSIVNTAVSPNATDFFYMGPASGLISLKKVLTSTSINRFEFTAIVSDQSLPERTAQASVIVNVRRSTLFPQFQNLPYITQISVNVLPGQTVYTFVSATDADLQGAIRYESTNNYFAAPYYFRVDPNNGDVILQNRLITDTSLSYVLGVKAYDTVYPNQVAYTNVTININRNPNAPGFNPSFYARTITEDYTIGISLVDVAVSDADGQNVFCSVLSITPPAATDYFGLNTYSCRITVIKSLLDLGLGSVQIIVTGADNGLPSRSSFNQAVVNISIIRNENDPVFISTPYNTIIPETTAIDGSTILRVTAADPDSVSGQTGISGYRLIGDDNIAQYFNFNGTTGVFTLKSDLTTDSVLSYTGRVVAYDTGSPPRSATVLARIFITRNLRRPTFQQASYNQTILETQNTRTSILTVMATDADRIAPYNRVTYQILTSNQDIFTYFELNSATGEISVRVPLYNDLSKTSSYTFNVQAFDGGSPSLTSVPDARVTIYVIRNLFPPVFQNASYSVTVPFTIATQTPVIDVLATDQDSQYPYNVVTYSILSDSVIQNRFTINPSTGRISTGFQTLTADTATSYIIRVVARDGGTPSLSASSSVIVYIQHNQNIPQFLIQNYTSTVYETQDLGVSILQLVARDLDISAPYNTLVFNLIGSSLAREYFDVNVNTGVLSVKKTLTLVPNVVTVTAEVSLRDADPVSPLSSQVNAFIIITIIHNQNTPYFINQPYTASLNENVNIGYTVMDVTARDDDGPGTPFGQIRYSIIGDDVAPNIFSINEISGRITVFSSLTQLSADAFQIRVMARDLGVPYRFNTSIVKITTQRNFRAPVFQAASYSQTVVETLALGNVILTVIATDADLLAPQNTIRYALTGNTEGIQCFLLNDVTGELTLRRSLLYEPCRADVFNLKAQARDLGTPPLTSPEIDVTIFVTRNKNPPYFRDDPYVSSINEDASFGYVVYRTSAGDLDTQAPFNTLSYSIIGDDSAPNFFDINSTTGIVTLRTSVQSDTIAAYRLRLMVQDGGTPRLSDMTTLTVGVQRNLKRPYFPTQNYQYTVYEDQDLGLSIGQVLARDDDTKAPNNIVRYEVTGTGSAPTYMGVFETDGVIYVKKSLMTDITDQTQYRLTVRAYDLGTPQLYSLQDAIVDITVIRNLNCPVFNNLPANITILQFLNSGTNIFNVSATDSDPSGKFSTIQYSIVGDGVATTMFTIDPTRGFILIASNNNLRSDSSFTYALRIRASDSGSIPCLQDAVLTINVQRNEFAPQWLQDNFFTTIFETHNVQVPVYTLTATDSDTKAPNNVFRYYLTGAAGNYLSLFYVNDVLGEVYLRTGIAGEALDSYQLTFVAIDSGFPRLTSRPANLTINIIRNKNPPVFINEPYIVEVSRNLVRNIQVYVVSATDADLQSPYNILTYSIIGDDAASTYFQIDGSSGSITVKEPFVNDAATTYHIRVFVQDGGNPRLSDTTIVTVNIRRNLDIPRFNPVEYTRTILETQALGVPIVRLTATDSDTTAPYNVVNYVLEGDTATLGYFILDTGTGDISLKKSVYSTNSSVPSLFKFQARALNPGFPESLTIIRANVTVIIVRNNNAPRFLQLPYQRTINENHNPGSSVFQTTAVDDDTMSPFGDLAFQLIGDDSGPGYFSIAQSGLITLNANTDLRLDPDTQYQLRVEVRDGGIPARSATAMVVINVVKNLFSPQFNSTNIVQITIPETTPIGTKLLDLAAYDLDRQAPENTITFSLSTASNVADFFFINPRTGQIFLTTSVLNIATSFFQFQVLATDGGTPARQTGTTVSITVTRETGRLSFALPSYAVVIPETMTTNTVVIRTVASPGTPTYRILSSSPIDQTYFNIVRNTGDIVVNGNLLTDPQQLTFFFLVIEASASGSLSTQTATATVNITVTRNAQAPRFSQDLYLATIRDITVPGTQVLQVTAYDQDVGDVVSYRLQNSSAQAQDYLYFNPGTGAFFLRKSIYNQGLDFYNFIVVASDNRGLAAKTAVAQVRISIVRDLGPPRFVNDPYSGAVMENNANGTSVSRVSAVDDDLQLKVVAYDTAYPTVRDTADVIISVTRNINSPFFLNTQNYVRTVSETYELGKEILQVSAMDQDNDVLYYSIIGDTRALTYYYINPDTGSISLKKLLTEGSQVLDTGELRYGLDGLYPAETFFSINPITGTIFLTDTLSLDTLQRTSYLIKCIAYDTAYPSMKGTATATVYVNRNPNPPVFNPNVYRVTLTENTVIGTLVVDTNATDLDRDILVYSIQGDITVNQLFYINPDNGAIYLKAFLTSTSLNQLTFNVNARDQSNPEKSAQATVIVDVTRDQFPPVFQNLPYITSTVESTVVATSIFQVTARDPDLRGQLVYGIIGDYRSPYYFRVDNSSGIIQVNSNLKPEYKTNTPFNLIVTAYDSLSPVKVATATVTINVVFNPSRPIFSLTSYEVTISEYYPLVTSVVQTSAIDSDGDVVRYSLLPDANQNQKALDYFYVEETTGLILLKKSPRSDTSNDVRYTMIVQARDQRVPVEQLSTSSVIVNVLRNRNPPFFLNLPYATIVSENTAVGSSVYQVTATDTDLQEQLVYEVVGDAAAPGYFSVNRTTGVVRVLSGLRTDVQTQYILRVRSYDTAFTDQTATATAILNIRRNERAPVFQNTTYEVTINETIAVGSCILMVTAVDGDGDRVTYTATQDADTLELFYLGTDSGQICVRMSLKGVSTKITYRMRITASDNRSPVQVAVIDATINVIRDLFPPEFLNVPQQVIISERVAVGTLIYDVNGRDLDLLGNLKYELVGDYPTQYFFSMNQFTGEITTQASVRTDSIITKVYTARVVVYDDLRPLQRTTGTVQITVLRNQNCPQFPTQYVSPIDETVLRGTIILRVQATDKDQGDRMTYTIQSATPNPAQATSLSYFYIDYYTGDLWLTRSVQGLVINSFQLTVRACDDGIPQCCNSSTVTIQVSMNAASPVFQNEPYTNTVPDTTPIGSSILKLTATDADLRGNMTYEVTSGSNSYPFRVNRDTGEVTLFWSTLINGLYNYTFNVQAYDNADSSRFDVTIVTIFVIQNPSGPIFTPNYYEVTVNQTFPLGELLINTTAVDSDGDSIRYYIEGDLLAQDMFYITNAGDIYLRKPFTVNSIARYTISLRASDQRTPEKTASATAIVNVRRDNFPSRFTLNPYQVQISENTYINSLVETVVCTDNDLQ